MLVKQFIILVLLSFSWASWTPRKLIANYPNWNNWWLNTRIGSDQFDTIYCAVARYNYSQSDPEHDLYILNNEGDTIRKIFPWHGYEFQPIVQDNENNNIYLSQPTIGYSISGNYHMDWGVTDDSNQIHSSRGASGDGVYYTKLAADGSRIIWNVKIYDGDPWSGKTCMAIDQRNYLYITWGDDIQFLVCAKSTDQGLTWKIDTLSDERVLSQPKIVCDTSNNLHLVWRTWTTGCQLHYMKLGADENCIVGNSIFAAGAETWDPQIAIDQANNIHIVYTTAASNNQNIYYTVITGNLDKNGEPASDSELTVIRDTLIQYDAIGLAYPKITIDCQQRPHVIFEQGQYGTNTDKSVYHIRGESIVSRIKENLLSFRINGKTVKAMPNPFVHYTKIPEYEDTDFEVFDLTGKLVGLFKGNRIAERLPAGVYFVKSILNSNPIRIVKLR
jgi:hypothetical protein